MPLFDRDEFDYWIQAMKVLLKSLELSSIVEEGYEELVNEDKLSTTQKNDLKEKGKKDNKTLYQIYQAIEKLIYEKSPKQQHQRK